MSWFACVSWKSEGGNGSKVMQSQLASVSSVILDVPRKQQKGFCRTIPPPGDAANHFQTIGGRISNLGASEHYIPEWIQSFPRNQKYSSNPKSDDWWSGRPDRWCQLTFCSGSDSESSSISKIAPFFFCHHMWNNQDLLVKQEEVPKDGNWNLGLSFELASSTKKTTTKAKTQNKIEKSSKQIEIYFWSDSDSFVIAKYSTCQILFSSLGDFLPAESESELKAKLFLFTISISIQKKTDNKSTIQYWIQLGI